MTETIVALKLSKSQAGILIALARKEAARARAGLDDRGKPMTESDRETLERYHRNLQAALKALMEAG